ncbi:hypothetical protein CK228_25190 [Mesorhizobium sp. WSM4312]|uniref:hypothetical protein n=1 Tax=unclassified Mesorhizobium TaxID=325217 RepID=UPI000BB086E8|nr:MULTISPECIES: hypothetical protein [unclassified Mesorhizobium]PBB66016.1 hypothetical protein CK228_25190 [Mesorhizobium sp. WSM4312]PBC19322.1 hypothetical protein CK226_29800 [Mesorhizobium sp. WSM4311]TRC77703.1 hypothetical protein FJV80_25475 [Mesorhizobium sp. WSM4310]TRC78096.1 hypothetical protein FJV81_11130 [Mesorhizobium sp. WSM4315]TRC79285.1 hypothetical protein FJV83_28885 [Mesorhizobium sp. WSM4307]
MSAILGNAMVITAALPLLFGIVLALLSRFAVPASSPVLTLLWAALLLFFYWDTLGPPVMPPVAASQKLVYLAFAGTVICILPERILAGRTASVLAVVALAAAFLWLGWRRIAAGSLDLQMIAALAVALLALIGAAMLMARPSSPSPSAEEPFLAPAAALSMSLSGAIVSVLGASIVTGQLLGSLAALTGGWCLVKYLATLRGGAASAWSKGVEFLLLYAAVTVLIQVALLAPKANPLALILSSLPLLAAVLVGDRLQGLLPGARPLRPLIAGLVIALPAMLAIVTAIVWAPHGAALGFS